MANTGKELKKKKGYIFKKKKSVLEFPFSVFTSLPIKIFYISFKGKL